MNLLKTSIFSSIETAIKLASGLVVIKYIAIEVGPEGVAFFGQFHNFISALIILVSGGFTTGLVRYSSQEKLNGSGQSDYLRNALGLGLLLAVVVSMLVLVFSKQLSLITLQSATYQIVFYLMSFCIVLIVLYQIIIAVFNGWGELLKLIVCKSIGSLLLLIFSLIFVHFFGLIGGLFALIIMQSIPAVIGIWLLTRVEGFQWIWLKPAFNLKIYKAFSAYWLMSMVTLVSTPLILMLVRSYIASRAGWETAGLWEASWKISELYLLVITSALTIYYVPNLSQATDTLAERLLVKEVFIWGVVSAACLAAGIYLFRTWIVCTLFSNDFSAVSDIIKFQLFGGVLKIAAWVFSYYMLIKKKTKMFLFSELLFGSSFYALSCYCFDRFGLIGLSYAYFFNYALYLTFCMVYFYHDNYLKPFLKKQALYHHECIEREL